MQGRSRAWVPSLLVALPTAFLLAFFVVYSSVFGVGYVYLIRLIKKGPQPVDTLTSNTSGTPARPLSAAESVPEEERI